MMFIYRNINNEKSAISAEPVVIDVDNIMASRGTHVTDISTCLIFFSNVLIRHIHKEINRISEFMYGIKNL